MNVIEDMTGFIYSHVEKIKNQAINYDSITEMLKEKLGDAYTSEIGIAVKNNLREHEGLDFFREGDYIHDMKYYYCVGNWLAIKGLYENPIEAKLKLGMLSWQRFEGDWEE